MKTLHVINSIDKTLGGVVSAALNIIRMENILGIDSIIITRKSKNIDPLFYEYTKIYQFPSSFPKRLYNSVKAIEYTKNKIAGIDIIIFHSVWSMLFYRIAKVGFKKQIPMILWAHGSIDPFDLEKKKYYKKLIGPIVIKKMFNRLNYIICTTKLEEDIIEKYGSTVKTLVVPLPVLQDSIIGDRKSFRDKYMYSGDDFILLFLSRVDYKKGLNLLLPAIGQLSNKLSNIKLIIAGSGSQQYEDRVHNWIKQYSLNEHVKFIGFVSQQNRADAYAGSDCFVLPSMNENFGIAIVEALNSGLPVMISNNVYIWEKIIEKNGGWVCEYSVQSVVNMIEMIYKNKNDYELKRNNAKISGEQFLPINLKNNYQMLYEKAIAANNI